MLLLYDTALYYFISKPRSSSSYRYFFKTVSTEFESGVVHEEVTDDNEVLPLWEGKVVGKVEKIE